MNVGVWDFSWFYYFEWRSRSFKVASSCRVLSWGSTIPILEQICVHMLECKQTLEVSCCCRCKSKAIHDLPRVFTLQNGIDMKFIRSAFLHYIKLNLEWPGTAFNKGQGHSYFNKLECSGDYHHTKFEWNQFINIQVQSNIFKAIIKALFISRE